VEVNEIEAVDIDEEEDFMIADAIYNHLIKENFSEHMVDDFNVVCSFGK
jgi:hypothetical protein